MSSVRECRVVVVARIDHTVERKEVTKVESGREVFLHVIVYEFKLVRRAKTSNSFSTMDNIVLLSTCLLDVLRDEASVCI